MPARIEYYIPPVNCSHAPRVQIYLKTARINTSILENATRYNSTYICDSFYCYYRSPLYANGTIAISRVEPQIIEMDFANPTVMAAELLRLSSSGVIENLTDADSVAAASAFSLRHSTTEGKFHADAGPMSIAYTPPPKSYEADWRQPGRFVALWGLQPLLLPAKELPAISQASITSMPLVQPATTPEGGEKTPPQPTEEEKQIPSAPPLQRGALEANKLDNKTSAPPQPTAQTFIEQLPWWAAPIALAAIGIFFMAVFAFYFRPRLPAPPTAPKPEMIELSDTRLAILEDLEGADRIPTDIALRLERSKSTVVEHLEGLCRQGLVQKVEERGKKFVYYRLTHEGKSLLIRRHAEASAA